MATSFTDSFGTFLDAVRSGQLDSIKRQLRSEPEFLTQREESEDGWGAIHHSIASDQLEAATILLDEGCSPNLPAGKDDGEGNRLPGTTPMAVAAWKGGYEAAKLLLKHGADPSGADHFGHSAVHVAAAHNEVMILNVLLAAGADPNPFSNRRHFDEELCWHFYGTPLHLAAVNNAVEAARVLLDHGAERDACWIDRRTPLFYAAAAGKTAVLKVLLEAGADPNKREDRAGYSAQQDYTPLHYAATNGHADAVKVLLSFGADPALRESKGKRTPRQLAEDNQHADVVALF